MKQNGILFKFILNTQKQITHLSPNKILYEMINMKWSFFS